MTPERVESLSNQAMQEAPVCGPSRAIERAITQAVNEALTEAIKPAMSEAIFWSDCNDTRAYKACELIIGAIDAMKLPEEP